MNTKTIYYILGGLIITGTLYYVTKAKGQTIRQAIIQDYNDITMNTATTQTVVTTGGQSINNVGNIKYNNDVTYEGEITAINRQWKCFASVTYGYRAMIELLRAYYKRGEATTLRTCIGRYAPNGDGTNDVNSYVSFVSDETGIQPDDDIYDILYSPAVTGLVKAMSEIEQGAGFLASNGITDGTIQQAYNIA